MFNFITCFNIKKPGNAEIKKIISFNLTKNDEFCLFNESHIILYEIKYTVKISWFKDKVMFSKEKSIYAEAICFPSVLSVH